MKQALLLIDIQNDFLPGGALAVARGDEVIPVANRLIPLFSHVVATQDWHPPGHSSFEIWPDHCIQESWGAELANGLNLPKEVYRQSKGSDLSIDSYSAFYDNDHLQSTGLAETLREWGVDQIVLMGLTTDYCVKYSALDGIALGFQTVVVVDGCRPVGDDEQALDELAQAGVRLCTADEIEEEIRR